MAPGTTDVLMITYDDAEAVRLSLPRLLGTLDEYSTVWLWHNGTDEETLESARAFQSDARVSRFHHSIENAGIRTPMNWLWSESSATYVSKVDDDCLVSPGWIEKLRSAHEDWSGFGAIGSWRHYPDEFIPELASLKIATYPGGHQLMRNHWVQGSGHLLRRTVARKLGYLNEKVSFVEWCIRAARKGYNNGFYYPFIFEDHMDDPKSEHSLMRTEADFRRRIPLSALRNGVQSLEEWEKRNRNAARLLQSATLDLKAYGTWRRRGRRLTERVSGRVTGSAARL